MIIELDTELEVFQTARYIEDPIRRLLNDVADEIEAEEYEGDIKDIDGTVVGRWEMD